MKIINDPVFGFIKIPRGLLYDIVKHPLFQRLHRIKQLGLACMVYPGAQHTRFQHSLGAFFLMGEAVQVLSMKGHEITEEEAEAVQAAILLHDIGHGPFSHVLEYALVEGVRHESISLLMMERMNAEMEGRLALAIQIFKDQYPKRFLHQLISSQLDVDRLDYLRRDSFFTGVIEGDIGSERIIKMLNVKEDQLVVEAKGIYSIENYLTSRRLMYWQVYLHKTSVACEKTLSSVLRRAHYLAENGVELFASPALRYFLYNRVDSAWFFSHPECLEYYAQLDDNDIWCALKVWCSHPDKVLSVLARCVVDRNLFRAKLSEQPVSREQESELVQRICAELGVTYEEAAYFYAIDYISNDIYSIGNDCITIYYNDGSTKDVSEASDMLNVQLLSKTIKKHVLCAYRFDTALTYF